MDATALDNFTCAWSATRQMTEQKIRDSGNDFPIFKGSQLFGKFVSQLVRFRETFCVVFPVLQRRHGGDLSRLTHGPRRRNGAQFLHDLTRSAQIRRTQAAKRVNFRHRFAHDHIFAAHGKSFQ